MRTLEPLPIQLHICLAMSLADQSSQLTDNSIDPPSVLKQN